MLPEIHVTPEAIWVLCLFAMGWMVNAGLVKNQLKQRRPGKLCPACRTFLRRGKCSCPGNRRHE